MGGNYEKSMYNQLMEVMARLDAWNEISILKKLNIKMMLTV